MDEEYDESGWEESLDLQEHHECFEAHSLAVMIYPIEYVNIFLILIRRPSMMCSFLMIGSVQDEPLDRTEMFLFS